MSLYKKIIILYVTKKLVSFLDMKNIKDKRKNIENRAFDLKMEYYRKTFGQNFIDYLSPKNYNPMPLN